MATTYPQHNDSISALENGMRSMPPTIEMIPNHAFSFPARNPTTTHRRPVSMFLQPAENLAAHKRTSSALPTFSFNAADTSGRLNDSSDDEINLATTPVRRGHRRGGSEFVGGDSRFGVDNAITSSPTKTEITPRRHTHRRSVAVSSHDLSQIMSEPQPRLSTSLPSTPLDMPTLCPAPVFTQDDVNDKDCIRPPSRPRVEFDDNVEIIPRPLSTISSETESSISVLGHSVSNSITSVMSSSPQHVRSASSGYMGSVHEARKPRSSIEVSKRIEKEGEWLKSRSQHSLARSVSEPDTTHIEFANVAKRQKRHTLGFDRRRSEPLISTIASQSSSRMSALSLQDMLAETPDTSIPEKRSSSGQKLKQWALSKLHKRYKPKSPVSQPEHACQPAAAETDLEAVFALDAVDQLPTSPTQISFETSSPLLEDRASTMIDLDEAIPMVDLDAALGPMRTPPLGSTRRHMHSDRASPGGYIHRRAESEPVLMTFNRVGSTPPQKSMEDVFEEDEEDTLPAQAGMGITLVDSDRSAFDPANPESLRQRRAARDSDRPFTSYITPSLAITHLQRPASIVDDVIVEESSPVDAQAQDEQIEIVQAYEEPRAPSYEKASDSSEASTLLAPTFLADAHDTPETYNASSFSSPDFTRRQGSFDASRIGTSASSIADTRTTSSCTTGEPHEIRMSVDDVPSLTSSRSTMMSTVHDSSGDARVYPTARKLDADQVAAKRKKRASIQSLSQLVGGTFGSSKNRHDDARPQTAAFESSTSLNTAGAKKKDNRLKKLMFWRSKQNLRQAARADAERSV